MKLSTSDLAKLNRAHPDLKRLALRIAELTPANLAWRVEQTDRTKAQQLENIKKGVSATKNSRHIPGKNKMAMAMDLTVMVNGSPSWSWPNYYKLQTITRQAARELGIKVTWGAVWDRLLNDLKGPLDLEHANYVVRFRRANNRSPLADGPHIELSRQLYPA